LEIKAQNLEARKRAAIFGNYREGEDVVEHLFYYKEVECS
jgi:hypothetical protein